MMAVSKRMRFEVLRRDNHQCRYCGATAPDTKLTVDHVVPTALGGSDEASNLVAACRDCNGGKSSVPADASFVEDVAADALRWSRAIERVAEIERESLREGNEFVRGFVGRIQAIPDADPYERTYCVPDVTAPIVGGPEGMKRTLLQFRECGLSLDDLEQAVRKASLVSRGISDQDNWKYFCGVAWGMIRDRQEAARNLLAAEDAGL